MVNQDGTKLTVIDFPQCISVNHPNAKTYFNRDVECVFKYFDKLAEKSYHQNLKHKEEGAEEEQRFRVESYPVPQLQDIEIQKRLDHEVKTVGHFSLEEYNQLEQYRNEEERMKAEMEGLQQENYDSDEEEEEEENMDISKEELMAEEKELNQLEKSHEMGDL